MDKQHCICQNYKKIPDCNIEKLFEAVYEEFSKDEEEMANSLIFLEMLRDNLIFSLKKRDKNQELYFQKNERIGLLQKIAGVFNEDKSISLISVTNFIATITVGVIGVSLAQEMLKAIAAIIFIAWMAVSIGLATLLEKRRRELLLYRYGQTWCRHSCTISYYHEEMIRFLSHISPYDKDDEIQQKKLFKERVMSIAHNNIEQFKHNMEPTKELIE